MVKVTGLVLDDNLKNNNNTKSVFKNVWLEFSDSALEREFLTAIAARYLKSQR